MRLNIHIHPHIRKKCVETSASKVIVNTAWAVLWTDSIPFWRSAAGWVDCVTLSCVWFTGSSCEWAISLSGELLWEIYFTSRKGCSLNLDVRGCVLKFPDWVDNEIDIDDNKHSFRSNTNACDGKIHLSHKIAIQLLLVAERCTICSSRSKRPVRKLLDTPS
jgi:hypothetical protein